jgi:hypothetical protein
VRGKGTERVIVFFRDYYIHEGLLRSEMLRSGQLRSALTLFILRSKAWRLVSLVGTLAIVANLRLG